MAGTCVRPDRLQRISVPTLVDELDLCHHLAMPNQAHLQAVQATIARMATQASTVKGWCVTVTAALLGFSATTHKPPVALVALYVVVSFAVLDCYYLSVERSFRRLYDEVVAETAPDWSLTISRPTLGSMFEAAKSPSVFILYGASAISIVTVAALAS
jgi:hypothetical protein